ncbi:hypothetical protein A2Z33_05600 [Candidatus Gottesmanbacteria bacterium RBG_16_52_11]|uniref:NAD-dependent epimerase/dehydratase domain-containing protein n=1 Tax=Candidatus Gottesmanbacteria bacterium RBG_16_52_11 TaxID=1798374 RepID=A0A1F5YNI4_9BACT|nr:MAG: hypothetical protein A2Z33_05600 [Candidatus Gottesmanbacteria bacterium RBG_16_52_11]
MRILVTGGRGFIGSYLTEKLLALGHRVYILDREINFADNPPSFRKAMLGRRKMLRRRPDAVYPFDIRSPRKLTEAMNKSRAEIVVHLAAVSMARPPKRYEHLMGPINLYGTLNVLNAFENSPFTRRLVFPSSSLAYGHYTRDPQPEESYLNPVNDYGIMKAACEYAIRMSKKEWVILRPTSVYGFTDCANRVTQLLLDAAVSGRPAWVIRGEALDFTYVEDVVNGFIKAIASKAAVRQIFNLSRGVARTADDFAGVLKTYFPKFIYEVRPPTHQEVSRGAQDMTKAKKILGFVPKSDIEDGIRKTLSLMVRFGGLPAGSVRLRK